MGKHMIHSIAEGRSRGIRMPNRVFENGVNPCIPRRRFNGGNRTVCIGQPYASRRQFHPGVLRQAPAGQHVRLKLSANVEQQSPSHACSNRATIAARRPVASQLLHFSLEDFGKRRPICRRIGFQNTSQGFF